MSQQIRLTLPVEIKALQDERALVVRITSPNPDRGGDVVVPKGGNLDNFRKNPVVLFGHDYWSPPIAKAPELSVDDDGILAKVQFPTKGTYEFADLVYELNLQGIMSAWSIGFRASREKIEILPEGGRKFHEWELFEFSAVPVPAHQDALTLLRSAGISEQVISKALDDEVLVAEEAKTAPDSTITDVSVEVAKDAKGIDLSFTLNEKTHTISYPLTDEQKEALAAEPEPDNQLKAQLEAMRDSFKAKDANLLSTLQAMKGLLAAQPTDKGGE